MSLLKEFRDFINRGNVVDLAVAVVIGTAFTAVVTSLVNDILLQVIAIVFGEPDFSGLTFTINDAVIYYGSFITAVVTFVLIAAAVFFVVKGYNHLKSMSRAEEQTSDEQTAPSTEDLLAEIRDILAAQNGGTPPPAAGNPRQF